MGVMFASQSASYWQIWMYLESIKLPRPVLYLKQSDDNPVSSSVCLILFPVRPQRESTGFQHIEKHSKPNNRYRRERRFIQRINVSRVDVYDAWGRMLVVSGHSAAEQI